MIVPMTLWNLQGQVLLLILLGFCFSRRFPQEAFRRGLTELIVQIILPSNIIASFLSDTGQGALKSSPVILLISCLIQVGSCLLAVLLFRGLPPERRSVLRYATICSNAGFLGTPIAEGLFGSRGVFLTSIYLIPQRIAMWSVGIIFFSGTNRRSLVKKVLMNPCIIAVVSGLLLLAGGIRLPIPLERAISSLSNCNTALSLFLIGMLMSDFRPRNLLDPQILRFSVLRLLVIPLLVLIGCYLLDSDSLSTYVAVLLSAMPAAGTTAVLANKYQADAAFAANCIAVTTLLSLGVIPFWCFIIPHFL